MTAQGKDWQTDISLSIAMMDKARNEIVRHASGPAQAHAFENYEGACLDFVSHIATKFGSAQGYASFLENETRRMVESKGLASDELRHLDWTVRGTTPVAEAESAATMFRNNYRRTMDDLAYITQFRHTEPAFEPIPS